MSCCEPNHPTVRSSVSSVYAVVFGGAAAGPLPPCSRSACRGSLQVRRSLAWRAVWGESPTPAVFHRFSRAVLRALGVAALGLGRGRPRRADSSRAAYSRRGTLPVRQVHVARQHRRSCGESRDHSAAADFVASAVPRCPPPRSVWRRRVPGEVGVENAQGARRVLCPWVFSPLIGALIPG